jgi:hypothetical protein
MIYHYIYLDYGAENLLVKLKYSIANLRHTLRHNKSTDKIHLWCARSVGRNPAYDAIAFEKNGLVDKIEWAPFHNQKGEIRIQPGWYNQTYLAFIKQAIKTEEPNIYIDANVNIFVPLEINENAFYVWRDDSQWYGLPWAFQTKDDACLFLETFYDKGILQKDPETAFAEYKMWNPSTLHIPYRFLSEIHDNYAETLDWIIDYYSPAYAQLYVACSCASQIALSFLIQDIAERENIPILTGREAFYPHALRFSSETEADVSGSLRILFDG